MLLTKQSRKKGLTRAAISFVINTIISTLLLIIDNEFFIKNSDAVLKEGKTYLTNSFDTLLALSVVFLIPAYLLYYLLSYFLKLRLKGLMVQILTGIVTTLVPVLALNLSTYGVDLANHFLRTEFIVMIFAGMLMALLDNKFLE